MSNPKIPISGCIIAQDEEKYIEKAILNMTPHVGELVVIDGGSKDKTIDIATKLGCKVVENKFDFDFSKQRNFAHTKCRYDWILWLDVDEYFSDTFYSLLPALVTATPDTCAGYQIFRKSIFDGEERGIDYQWRLVNKVFSTWTGKIHEGIQFNAGYTGFKVPKEYFMTHEHTMKRQLFNNALYYNVNNDIKARPENNKGMEYHEDKWIEVETDRNG